MPSIRPVVQLTGVDGNAFMVIGVCMKAARKAGMPKEDMDMIRKEMMSGDYNHLLATAIKYFEVDGEELAEECDSCGNELNSRGICDDCDNDEGDDDEDEDE